MIFMDISMFNKQSNGLSYNNIKKFKTPVFIFSKVKTVSQHDFTMNIPNNCKRIIISNSLFKKSNLQISNYKKSDLIKIRNNFNDWIIFDKVKHSIFTLEIYKKDSFKNTNYTKNEIVMKSLTEENYIEYYLDNPLIYDDCYNIDDRIF